MNKQLTEKLNRYLKTLAQPSQSITDITKVGLSSAAALSAFVSAPVELSSQVVCGNLGTPVRTVGDCVGGTGDLGNFGFNYCAIFDLDGDGTNELQVRYYNYFGVYPAASFYVDPLQGVQLWSVRVDPYFGDSFPAYPVANYYQYMSHYSDKIFIVPLSGGAGFGFIAIDSRVYSFTNGNHTGSHPITGQPICCWAYGEVTMWGADAGIVIDDFMVIDEDVTDCTNVSPVLPVELVNFKSTIKDKSVVLSWTTESEINNAGFAVERSIDGKVFEEVKFVNGKGESTNAVNYSFVDVDVREGMVYYYRLRQIDFDGGYSLSDVVSANLVSTVSSISFSPNPTSDFINIHFISNDKGSTKIELFSSTGSLLKSLNFNHDKGDNEVEIDVSTLPKGITFLKTSIDETVRYEKIVIH